MWYALVQDEQLGPMSVQELGELFSQGVVTVDTFIWREGMGEWKPLTQVDEFLEITNAVVMDLADHGGPIAVDEGDEDDVEGATLMIGAEDGGAWAGYLDGLSAKAPAMASEPVGPPAPEPPPAVSPLDAAPAPVVTPPPAHFEPPELHAPPEFAGEFSAPAVPAPQPAPAGGGNKKLIGILAALLLLGGGGAAAVLFLSKDDGGTKPGPGGSPSTQAVAVATQAPATQAPATQAPPPDAAPPVDAGVPDAEADAMVLDFIDVRPDQGPPDAAPPPKRKLTPEEIAARKKAREERIARHKAAKAAAEAKRKAAAAAAANKGKPKMLSRDDIQSVIRANSAKFDACAKKDEKAKGTVVVAMRIKRDGSVPFAKVATARVRKTDAAKCLETAMKGLKFKAFAGDPMRINLPLKL